MVFMDRTFCADSEGCGNSACNAYLTKQLRCRATAQGYPVAYADLKTDTCGFVPLEVA